MCALLLPVLEAGLDSVAPSAPVKDFRFPRFGENGYTQWVLRGARGIYDGPEQIRVEDMALRVYTGDERMAVELSMDSPAAVIRLKENRAESAESIRIVGTNFEIDGNGWTWDGVGKDIQLLKDSRVKFRQALQGDSADEAGLTVVKSESLKLKTTAEEYAFDFTGSVQAESGEMRLESDRLLATADTPAGGVVDGGALSGELQSLRDLLAEGSVKLEEGERRLKADRARFYPGTQVVELDGSVQVESAGALINGEHIRSESGIVTITGDEALGRAQMVLVQAGGLGLSGSTDLNETTLIHADRIVMREKAKETEFEFEGRVEIFSGSLTLRAEQLLVYSSPHKKDSDNTEDAEDLPVGEVRELYARGSVYIEDRGMEVQAEEGRFFPMKERAKLSGNPRLSHEGAVVSGARMELSATKARVFAEGDRRVRVLLPELPNLGYDAEGEATVISNEATLVESNRLEMNRSEEGQLYIFEEKVEVTGTNLKAYCERMEVKAVRGSLEASSSEGLMDGTQIETIEAMDGVRIEQEGRVATSDRALIEPLTSRLVLTGDARVDDERGQVRGERLILNQGERRAIVEAGGDGKRARVTLPELPQSRD